MRGWQWIHYCETMAVACGLTRAAEILHCSGGNRSPDDCQVGRPQAGKKSVQVLEAQLIDRDFSVAHGIQCRRYRRSATACISPDRLIELTKFPHVRALS